MEACCRTAVSRMRMLHASFATGVVIGMTESGSLSRSPSRRPRWSALITKLLTPLTPLVPQSEAAQN